MSSTQPLVPSSVTEDHMDKVNNFNLSMLIGLLIITIAVLIIMSIIMNIWMKNKQSKIMPYIHEKNLKNLPTVPSKTSKTDKLLSFQLLTPPKLVFNKDTTLPVYRKTDTWDQYLKMIQSPAKLNDIVRTMKIEHTPLSNVKSNFPENNNTNDNGKISYDNGNNCYNHTLQRESLHLQQKIYNRNDLYHFI